MKVFKRESEGAQLVLKLDRGEEIIETLGGYLTKENIQAGYLSGIGAVEEVTLGYYDLHAKEYRHISYDGEYELLNLTGNVSLLDSKVLVHAHVTLSGPDLLAFGGHLMKARVAVTAEIWLFPSGPPLIRKMNDEMGLNLLF